MTGLDHLRWRLAILDSELVLLESAVVLLRARLTSFQMQMSHTKRVEFVGRTALSEPSRERPDRRRQPTGHVMI